MSEEFEVTLRVCVSVVADSQEEAEFIAHDWVGVCKGAPEDTIDFITCEVE
jgi:hypothetical protein